MKRLFKPTAIRTACRKRRAIHKSLQDLISWILIIVVMFGCVAAVIMPRAHATTPTGTTTLYLKKDPSDINSTYNALTLNNSETQTDSATATTSTTTISGPPPTSFCEASTNTGETFTQISASAASTGNRCLGTFISPQVGLASDGSQISISTSDAASISADMWTSESSSQITSIPLIYIYRWNGSGTTLNSADLIASWSTTTAGSSSGAVCADPGTTAAVCTAAQTATKPANNITFAATDRIVLVIGQDITKSHTSAYASNFIDNSTRSPSSSISLGYSLFGTTPNKPTLSGSMDDDFTTAQAATICSVTTYNSKWSCPAPANASATAEINSADTNGAGGDNTGWLTLRNKCNSGCTPSNFGTTPSNAFIYQPLSAYANGNVRTVVNSALTYQVGSSTPASPYNHVGLVLWTSNTDYLEVQLYSTGVKSSTNTVQVALNNSGTLGTATNINTSTTLGTYGRVWLGITNTGGSYQAQYSTDGSTWTNVGTAITHAAPFSRVGLNSFAALAAANYGGAFEWFQSTLAAPSYTQSSASWFANADSTAPGGVHGSANTLTYTTLAASEKVRLRLLLRISGQAAAGSTAAFSLQYADKGSGSCASPSGGTPAAYTDVTTSTLIAFYNNPTPADGANISNATGDPTDASATGGVVNETYEESNPFSPSQTSLAYLSAGKWDISLIDNGATAGATYCFRAANSDDSFSNFIYSGYPALTLYTLPGPTSYQIMRGGMWFNGGTKQSYYWAQ